MWIGNTNSNIIGIITFENMVYAEMDNYLVCTEDIRTLFIHS